MQKIVSSTAGFFAAIAGIVLIFLGISYTLSHLGGGKISSIVASKNILEFTLPEYETGDIVSSKDLQKPYLITFASHSCRACIAQLELIKHLKDKGVTTVAIMEDGGYGSEAMMGHYRNSYSHILIDRDSFLAYSLRIRAIPYNILLEENEPIYIRKGSINRNDVMVILDHHNRIMRSKNTTTMMSDGGSQEPLILAESDRAKVSKKTSNNNRTVGVRAIDSRVINAK